MPAAGPGRRLLIATRSRHKLRELGEMLTVENTPTSRGILDKVKEMFS